MTRPRKVKADHRADTRGTPWAGIPHAVLDSLAYRHLDLWGRAILVEIVREMNGYNNGSIGLSQRQLAARLGTSNFRKIGRGIAQVMAHGLIDVTMEGRWKERLARQYRLTFVNTGTAGNYKPATNDYLHWRPCGKTGADPVSAAESKFAEPVSAEAPSPAEGVSAVHDGNPPKSPIHSAEPVSSLISKPYLSTETKGGLTEIEQDGLRRRIAEDWAQLDHRKRKVLAAGNNLTFEELRDFIMDRAQLPFPKQVALCSAAKRMVP